MKVCIKAMDQLYSGLYGMYDIAIVEVADMEEAEEIGCEMSRDVIDSYSCITEQLTEEALEVSSHEGDYPEMTFEESYEDCVREDISYTIWQLKDDAPIEEIEIEEEYLERWKK